MDRLYLLKVKNPEEKNALDLSIEYEKSLLVEYAEPNWVQLNSAALATPNDKFFSSSHTIVKGKNI